MTVAGDNILKVTARLLFESLDDVQNVFYVQLETGAFVLDTDALEDMAAWLETIYAPIVDSLSSLITFDVVDVWNLTQDQPVGSIPWPTLTVGTGTAETLPPGCAALVTASTGQKNTRGRKFFGVLTELGQSGGLLSLGLMGDLAEAGVAWAGAFFGATSTESWLPGVVDKMGSLIQFNGVVVRRPVAYQRRRKQGIGG